MEVFSWASHAMAGTGTGTGPASFRQGGRIASERPMHNLIYDATATTVFRSIKTSSSCFAYYSSYIVQWS